MARPVDFDGSNMLLVAPEGCSREEVADLPCLRLDGSIVSCWELTAGELAEIIATGRIWLSVWGRQTQPPVLVTGHREWAIG